MDRGLGYKRSFVACFAKTLSDSVFPTAVAAADEYAVISNRPTADGGRRFSKLFRVYALRTKRAGRARALARDRVSGIPAREFDGRRHETTAPV